MAVDPTTVQTPALDLIDEALMWAYRTRGARLIISIAPQEGKTRRVTQIGSLWALTEDPERRLGIASYQQKLAEMSGRTVRNLITSNDGTDGTLDLGLRIAPDHGAASLWELDGHRGGVICVGIGSGLNGRPLEALIIDDPFADMVQAESLTFRERAWSWWQSVGAARLAPGAPVIQIATRWHEDDLAGRLQKGEDGHRWRVINIPAQADHSPEKGQSDPLGREPGEWLQSARGRTIAEWEQIRIQAGTRVFTALYQGRPSPDQGNVWRKQWWRRYTTPMWSQHPTVPGAWLVHDVDQVLISVDASFKDKSSSDYVVMQVWARRGANAYLLDQVRKRLSFTDTLTAFTALCAKWPDAIRKLVEDKANGTAVIDSLNSKIPGLKPVNPTDSKFGRATAVAPVIESGNVLLPDASIALFDPEELITEAAQFPNGSHDDMVDATSQALAEMFLDGTGAQAWIDWARRKAEARAAGQSDVPVSVLAAASETVAKLMAPPPPDGLHECGKPDCTRLVSTGAAYCCGPCSDAAQGRYEIHAHDFACDQRAGDRSPEPFTETAAGLVARAPEPGNWLARDADGRYWTVRPDGSCNCDDGQARRLCGHVQAAIFASMQTGQRPLAADPVWIRQTVRNAASRGR